MKRTHDERDQHVEAAVARGKAEILADIAADRVPADISTFSALHDYVDANEYGGICEEAWVDWYGDPEDEADDSAIVQSRLHRWLWDGRPQAGSEVDKR